jgi:Mn2+/Fe2+ NRAMP family transporter
MERMGDAQKKQVTANEAQESGESFLQHLGPGLITGAADDDPSGIATYSEVGAQFGFGMLWTTLFSYPLMASIQEICGRLGRITGTGIAANLKRCYPSWAVYSIVGLLWRRISSIWERMWARWEPRPSWWAGEMP